MSLSTALPVRQITLPSLTDEQNKAVSNLAAGLRNRKRVQTLGGYAGTGKTTLVRALKAIHPDFAVGAFTGKAANMLRKKGVFDACTIHSLIYLPRCAYDCEEKCDHPVVRFVLRESPPEGATGFIIDEASMVGESIYKDLLSFGLPCIFIGDYGQLEPIEAGFNLMANPDYKLEHVHRHAGEIPRFAEWLRLGRRPRDFQPTSDAVSLIDGELDDRTILGVDQIICAYNRTRVQLNFRARKVLRRNALVEVGDRIICLRNHRDEEIFNGMQGTVTAVVGGRIDFGTYDGVREGLEVDRNQFGREKGPEKGLPGHVHPFDYAYAITCHKAQGDEWPLVLVIEERCYAWDHRRWTYTAASRAQEKLWWRLAGAKGGAR